jgi:hypothetical protein
VAFGLWVSTEDRTITPRPVSSWHVFFFFFSLRCLHPVIMLQDTRILQKQCLARDVTSRQAPTTFACNFLSAYISRYTTNITAVRYQSVGYGAEDRGRPRDPPKVSEPYGFGVPPLKTHLRVKRQHVTSTAWRVRGSGRPRPQGKRTNRTRFGRSTYTAGATRDQICDN